MTEPTRSESLGDLGEERLVERIVGTLRTGPEVVVGPGDDCAAVDIGGEEWQLLKTDCLVEGVHFAAGTDPLLVGHKAMNRSLSDIAAMGGRPGHALVTIASHPDRAAAEVEGWYRGMVEAGALFGCAIVGGETAKLPERGAVISIALTGFVRPEGCVRRGGSSVGDAIAVTGRLGGSFESGRHLAFTPRIAEARWLCEHRRPTSMMDLSDGLGSDLPRLARAAGLGYRVDLSKLPLHEGVTVDDAVANGEDYELLMTLAPEDVDSLREEWRSAFPDLPLTVIGEITETTEEPLERGWEHYRGDE
ncbi:MAG: thiamine-phosphate kinase [Verrucomicrobiales bacterium]